MSKPLFTNNAATALAVAITPTSTVLQVVAGTGQYFPQPAGGDYFMLTLIQINNPEVAEIVQCTSRTGDYLTVVRGQEGTQPQIFNLSDNVQLRITAGSLNLFASESTAEQDLAAYKAAVASSTGSSLVGYSQSGSNTVTTTVQAELQKTFRTSDYTTFSQALTSANNNTLIVDSTIAITSNTTIPSTVQLIVNNGGLFTINTGITLTINGPFQAGLYQIFNCVGTGAVVFNTQFVFVGYAEWWGAVTNVQADQIIPLTAAIVALSKVQLMPADYFINSTLKIDLPNKCLAGSGNTFTGSGNTRILMLNGTDNILQLGPNTNPSPGNINGFVPQIVVQNLTVSRSVAPVISSGCVGISSQFTVFQRLTNVGSYESMISFEYQATAESHTDFCVSHRFSAGSGVGTDFHYGFYCNGNTAAGGGILGNSAIYFSNCKADISYPITGSVGFYASMNFNDIFVRDLETIGQAVGAQVNGTGSTGEGCVDCHLIGVVNDGFLQYGVYITNTPINGAIEISGGYSAPSATSAVSSYGVAFSSSNSAVAITNHQVIAQPSANCGGMLVLSSSGIQSIGNMFIDCTTAAINVSESSNCTFQDHARNSIITATGAAVDISGTNTRLVARMQIDGDAGSFLYGYRLASTTTTYSEFNCSGVDPICITGGSGNKLLFNNTQITVAGAFSSANLASGIMA